MAITGACVTYYTEKEWNDRGYQVYKSEITNGKLGKEIDEMFSIVDPKHENDICYSSLQVGHNLFTCEKCGKETSHDLTYFRELINKMKPVLKCKLTDDMCDECIRELTGLDEGDILDF